MGEPLPVKKTVDHVFFERIIGLLPMHVKDMSKDEIIRCLEVMVSRNIGSNRLFDHYILMMIEKHMMKYDVPLYSRLIRALADK